MRNTQNHLAAHSQTFDGNPATFSTLFQIYRPGLLSHALYICGNTPNAQDALQDTFISAWTHLHTLKDKKLLFPWLKKILENHCYMMMRRQKWMKPVEEFPESDTALEDSIHQNFEQIADHQAMWQSLEVLSEDLRSCVLLRYFSTLKSYDEIAITLDIPVGTVRSRLNAAKKKLHEIFFAAPDADDKCLKEAQYWTEFYTSTWNNMHKDAKARNELYNHFHPQLKLRFTSGKGGQGRVIIEKEIDDDLHFGSCVEVKEVISSGSVSVIEAVCYNSTEFPDRCPPATAFVAFRQNGIIHTGHIYDSPRL